MARKLTFGGQLYVIAALTIVVTSLLTCCTRVQTVVVPAPIVVNLVDSVEAGLLAVTDCDKYGQISVISTTAQNVQREDWPFTMAHEIRHAKQWARSGLTCKEYDHKYSTDADFRLQIEAEAYCVELVLREKVMGIPWQRGVENMVGRLANNRYYQLNMPTAHIEAVVTKSCNEVSHESG